MYAQELEANRAAFVATRVSAATRHRYTTAWQAYLRFCTTENLAPVSVDAAVLYTMHLATRTSRSWAGISNDITGLAHFLPASVLNDPEFSDARRAARRCTAERGVARKRPITPQLLQALRTVIRQSAGSPFLELRDWSAFLLGFLGLFRVSELVSFRWTDLHWTAHGLRVHVRSSKTDQFFQGTTVFVTGHHEAALDIRTLLTLLRQASPASEFVFTTVTGGPLAPDTLRSRLKQYLRGCLPANEIEFYSMHSLRRGGATAMAQRQVPLRIIQQHGRWKSDAVRVYIEADLSETSAGSLVLSSLLL